MPRTRYIIMVDLSITFAPGLEEKARALIAEMEACSSIDAIPIPGTPGMVVVRYGSSAYEERIRKKVILLPVKSAGGVFCIATR